MCYSDPRQRIELSFMMREATFTKLVAQRKENGRRIGCEVKPISNGVRRVAICGVSEDGLKVWPVGAFFQEGCDYEQA